MMKKRYLYLILFLLAVTGILFYTFFGKSTPTTLVHRCPGPKSNSENQILVGSDPAPGGTVLAGGKIRVWVSDEEAPYIAPGEVADPSSGQITTKGDRTSTDVDTDGEGKYLWEPTIYIITNQPQNADGVY